MALEATESCIDLGPYYTKAFINSTSEEGITEGANNANFVDKFIQDPSITQYTDAAAKDPHIESEPA
ncbi:unnamed protein product [Amaranthus hypochondriacus]